MTNKMPKSPPKCTKRNTGQCRSYKLNIRDRTTERVACLDDCPERSPEGSKFGFPEHTSLPIDSNSGEPVFCKKVSKQYIAKKLGAKKLKPCNICNNESMIVLGVKENSHIPTDIVCCSNCGALTFHSLKILGFTEPDKTRTYGTGTVIFKKDK